MTAPTFALAVNPSELEQQIERVRREREVLLEEQRKLQQELEEVNKEARTLGSAVKSLDATRQKLAKDISVTESRVTSASLNIQSLESTMTKKEQQIFIHRRAIADTLAVLSEHDSRPLLFNLLASASLADVWSSRSSLEGLLSRLETEVNDLRETRKVLNMEKEEKEKVKEEQESLQNQLSGQKLVVEENKKAKEQLLSETKNTEALYQKMLTENLARQKEFEEDLFRLESELNIILDPSLIPSSRPGILSWPLDFVYITQQFGRTSDSVRLYASGTHNGVDFRASVGTPVKVVLSGVVEGVGNTDEKNAERRRAGKKLCYSYGGWILIKHNNGLSSVYAHLSARLVKVGQSVKTGDIIGYSGGMPGQNGSGHSTGPHLHLGLFASQGVQIQQFVNSRGGCQDEFVPIADPKAYLDPLAYLPGL
jgi:murein DD-endopeptidase MepM/ murein hydrolase activator NlpD